MNVDSIEEVNGDEIAELDQLVHLVADDPTKLGRIQRAMERIVGRLEKAEPGYWYDITFDGTVFWVSQYLTNGRRTGERVGTQGIHPGPTIELSRSLVAGFGAPTGAALPRVNVLLNLMSRVLPTRVDREQIGDVFEELGLWAKSYQGKWLRAEAFCKGTVIVCGLLVSSLKECASALADKIFRR
jgi:hypothetical protein